jgi:hypothetical protein
VAVSSNRKPKARHAAVTGADKLREPFGKFVDWWQRAAVMKMEAVNNMLSCIGGGNVVVA